jgi:hypothetical protein
VLALDDFPAMCQQQSVELAQSISRPILTDKPKTLKRIRLFFAKKT